jgi:hypothetical protein
MKKTSYGISFIITFLLITLNHFGCSRQISLFNPVAYDYAVSIKVESLALMDKAVEPFESHKPEVTDLILKIEKAYEYAKGIKKNEITVQQWEILKNPDRNLLGGFLKRWEDEEKLGKIFVSEAKKQVSQAYDTIIGLESGKIKPEDIK